MSLDSSLGGKRRQKGELWATEQGLVFNVPKSKLMLLTGAAPAHLPYHLREKVTYLRRYSNLHHYSAPLGAGRGPKAVNM